MTRTLGRHAITLFVVAVVPLTLAACAADNDIEETDSSESELRWRRCVPRTCEKQHLTCGSGWDGCGHKLDCGACPPPAPPPPTSPAPTSSTPPAPTTSAPPPAPTSPTPAPTPTGFTIGQRPFSATSSWNTPVAAGATYRALSWPASTGYNYTVNWDAYSPAVYVGTSADPLVKVSIPNTWGWPAQTLSIRLPAGVTGATGTDGEIVMIDGTTIHNCWQFERTSATTGSCVAYGRADALTGTGWGTKSPFLSAGIVAAGASEYAGLLVQAETDAGEIEHALQILLDGVLQKPNPVGEAISSDGGSATGIAQEGERLAIPPAVAMPSGLSPLGQKVFRAFKKYGVFDIDVAGGCTTLRAQANAYDEATIVALVRDVNKLIPLLQAVR